MYVRIMYVCIYVCMSLKILALWSWPFTNHHVSH